MLCVLIGIVPFNYDYWGSLKRISVTDDYEVEWREHSEVYDDDGIRTFLVSAVSELSDPALLEHSVKVHLRKDFGVHIETVIWASIPAPVYLKPTGGYQLTFHTETDRHLLEWGIMVQEGLLDSKRIIDLRKLVDDAINQVEDSLAIHRPNINIGQDNFIFREIASRNLERFDLRVNDQETCAFVTEFIMNHPEVKKILYNNLGSESEIDFDISVVYSKPGACTQGWHADGDHQKGGSDAGWSTDGWKKQSQAYAFCLFIPLINLNDEVGFTQFWPKSHYSRQLAGFGPVAQLCHSTFDGKCSAGDAIWYDYRLMHRGMPNCSVNTIRPVLQIVFKKKWYIEKSNFSEEPIAPSENTQTKTK